MEISGIRSSMPFMFQGKEMAVARQDSVQDTVEIRSQQLLSDEEARSVLSDTINMIGSDRAGALAVHSGLSESRVFALLGV